MVEFSAAAVAAETLTALPGDGAETYRLQVDTRKEFLRADTLAREELAAESVPAVPPVLAGDVFLSQPDTEPPWRIGKLWPAGGNVILSAQFKAGKTTLRDNLVRSWCDGTPFLGHYPVTPPPGRLLVVDAEMTPRLARRWLADQMIVHADRFGYVSLRGAPGSFGILSPAARADWASALAGAGGLLLDCIGPVMAALGLDENKSSDAGRFLAALETLACDAGIAELFVVHHMGHGTERSRGTSRLRDWPDASWQLVRQDDNPGSARYFSAFGRDVDVGESRLDYDPACRWLTVAGGSRASEKVSRARADLLTVLADEPGLSYRAIEDVLSAEHAQLAIRHAIKSAVADGELYTERGPRNAKLHYLTTQAC